MASQPEPLTPEWASDLVSLDSIRIAAGLLPDEVAGSPIGRWHGNDFLKLESLQPTGSFKIRGALTKLGRLSDEQRARGVVAYSSGNHGLAVARAARRYDVAAVVVVPSDAPVSKVAAIAAEGSTIRVCEPGSEERRSIAESIARETGQALIPPYDDADVIAGQGTIGLELMTQLPGLEAIFVPVGGGGLISGIAAAVKRTTSAIRVIGVEPELAADARESLTSGRRVEWSAGEVGRTVADALRTQSLGLLTFAHIREFVDEIVTVPDEEMLATTALLLQRRHIVAEPAGALALAALRAQPSSTATRVAIVSGGNASVDVIESLLERVEQQELIALSSAQVVGRRPTSWGVGPS
jgi:threo-3-hydroxy-L-aspartate ammonia-lyase